jgi:zinc D-Ala-D-Ala carboxypeptidase
MKISKYLDLKQVSHSQTAIRKKIDNTPENEHLDNIKHTASFFDIIFDQFNGKLRLSSFYRGKKLNTAVGGSKTSQHMTGEAMDIQAINGVTNADIYRYIKDNLNFDQLIWEYGTSKEPAWVHVSFKANGKNRKQILKIG